MEATTVSIVDSVIALKAACAAVARVIFLVKSPTAISVNDNPLESATCWNAATSVSAESKTNALFAVEIAVTTLVITGTIFITATAAPIPPISAKISLL